MSMPMPDPMRCPDCGGYLTGDPRCVTCGLLLQGPDAIRLWQVCTELARLDRVRVELLQVLRPDGAPRVAATTGNRYAASRPAAAGAPAAAAGATYAPAVRPAPRPRREWTPQRVQNLLLATGALLLVTAAIAFTVLAWGRLNIAARGAVMVGVTAVAGWTAHRLLRRGLTASAEAIALLAVLFAVVDAYAARRTNLAGLGGTDTATYWSVATAVLAAMAGAYGQVVRVRSVRWAALVGAQLPLVITAGRLGGLTAAERGAFLVAQAAALGAAAPYLRSFARPARLTGLVNWSVAVLLALHTAYESAVLADVRVGGLVLVAAGAVALLWPGDKRIPAGVTTASVVLAAVGLAEQSLTNTQVPAAVAAIGLLVVVAAALVPYAWRVGPLTVGAGTVAAALATVGPYLLVAAFAPFGWLGAPWDLGGDAPARAALLPGSAGWEGTVVVLAVVAVALLTVVVAAEALRRRAFALWPAAALAAGTVLLTPLGFAWSYRVALAWDVWFGLAGLAVAALRKRPAFAAPASFVLVVATAWSVADERATLTVLAVVTLAYVGYAAADATLRQWTAAVAATGLGLYAAAVAAATGLPVERIGFVLALTGLAVAGAGALLRLRHVEVVAAVTYATGLVYAGNDTGWLAWSLGAGAVAAALIALRNDRRLLAGAAVALGIACAATTSAAYGAPLDRTGFVLAVAAAVAVGVGALLPGDEGDLVEAVGAAAYLVALVSAASDPGWLSWALALGGLVALADALRPERRYLNWVATVLLTLWTWDRLFLAGVRAPEAYTAPVWVLVLALGHLRRVREPDTGSWPAYGRGLVVAFTPTTLLMLNDPGLTRPVVLAVAGMLVLFAGVRERLQAPLTVGAVALAVDALVQLAPTVAALPKWATIGAAGLAVIAVGVTYEDRRRDMARLRETYDSLV
jgi:hypothetical protein